MNLKIKKEFAISIVILFIGSIVIPNIYGMKDAFELEYKKNNDILNFKFEKPEITKINLFGQLYDHIEIKGLSNYDNPGYPIIPIKYINFLIPYGKSIDDISVTGYQITLPGEHIIEPGQMPYPIGMNDINDSCYLDDHKFTYPNEKIYSSMFPDVIFHSKTQDYQGYHILQLTLYPVHINNKKLSYYNEMTVDIKLKDETTSLMNYHENKNRIANMVINPEYIETYPHDKKSGDEIEYIIITTSEFKDSFQNLSEWKSSRSSSTPYKDINSTIILLNNITSDPDYWYNGVWGDDGDEGIYNDTQCQIRNFIKMAYNEWNTEYVLLGGDVEVIPDRKVHPGWVYDVNFSSDTYFVSLDGNWDANGNGLFGEIDYDEVEYYSHLFVGRSPVSSVEEADNFIAKTIAYEQSTANNDEYLKKTMHIGEEADYKTDCGVAEDANIEIIPQYTTIRKYARDGRLCNKNDISENMNNGVHIISYGGHSYYDTFSSPISFEKEDVDQLTNSNYFLIYSIGCHTAKFDEDDAIAESFVTHSSGAFAYIGNSHFGFFSSGTISGTSSTYEREFFDILNSQTNHLGKALQYSKESHIGSKSGSDIWVYLCINLLGDPETEIKIEFLYPTAQLNMYDPYNPYGTSVHYNNPIIIDKNDTITFNITSCKGLLPGSTFNNYTIEIGQGNNPNSWTVIKTGYEEIFNENITCNISEFDEGLYTIRLISYDQYGNTDYDDAVVAIIYPLSVCNVNNDIYYSSIQDAIYGADDYNTIVVNGTHYEKLVIPEWNMITLYGHDAILNNINRNKAALILKSSFNTVQGFTFFNTSDLYYSNPDSRCDIFNYDDDNSFYDNTILCNMNRSGIRLTKDNNIFIGNKIIGNGSKGILMFKTEYNNIYGNTITNMSENIYIGTKSYYNSIKENVLINRNPGIYDPICYNILMHGIPGYEEPSNNTITGNIIKNSYMGICIYYSRYNTISENNFDNNIYGAWMSGTDNNTAYHNNFNNSDISHALVYDSYNMWHNSTLKEGNYWDDYTDKYPPFVMHYPSTTWTIHYEINDDNIDFYPLINPHVPDIDDLSVNISDPSSSPNKWTLFSCDVDGGRAPYKFEWDFGDDNTSTQMYPAHIYSQIGEYTVNVTVWDFYDNVTSDSVNITIEY